MHISRYNQNPSIAGWIEDSINAENTEAIEDGLVANITSDKQCKFWTMEILHLTNVQEIPAVAIEASLLILNFFVSSMKRKMTLKCVANCMEWWWL